MKSLLLNTFDIEGGAAIATHRLHQSLRAIGVDSSLLVQRKKSDDFSVIGPQTRWQSTLASARPYLDGLIVKKYKSRQKQLFSPAVVPDQLASCVQKINPDIVHLFWVTAGFMRLETLAAFKKPIVWTMHDMWPLTGGCHYDGECGKFRISCGACPVLNSNKYHDLSYSILKRKERSWKDLPITVVATSRWLSDMARESAVFKNKRIEILPNPLDTERYKPINKDLARQAWGLPLRTNLILFSAFQATSDKRKGNQFLLPALKQLARSGWSENTELLVVGATRPENVVDLGMKTHYMGHLSDEISQVLLYSAADVTVAPSMQENLSNTVMESLACGTPVVAFNIGGMPDLIEHEKSGYLARPFEHVDLADGIAWVLQDKNRQAVLSSHARAQVEEKYAMKIVAQKYIELYRDILL